MKTIIAKKNISSFNTKVIKFRYTMRVLSIKQTIYNRFCTNKNITFCSEIEDKHKFDFVGDGENVRAALREDFLDKTGVWDLYKLPEDQRGRISEYELDKMINTLTTSYKKAQVIEEKVQTLNLENTEQKEAKEKIKKEYSDSILNLDKNIYYGNNLTHFPKTMQLFKQSGVKTIIDLSYITNYHKQCTKMGLNYVHFPLTQCSSAFKKKGSLSDWKADWEIRSYIENTFIPCINLVNNGNVYFGCYFGTFTTWTALSILKPFLKDDKGSIALTNYAEIPEGIANLYGNLSDKHKELLGISKEDDKKIMTKLKS